MEDAKKPTLPAHRYPILARSQGRRQLPKEAPEAAVGDEAKKPASGGGP